MKHKLLTAVVATASALCLCLGLAACGDNGGTNGTVEGGNNTSGEHEHVYTAENKCSVCGEEWEYTEGLEYELNGDTYKVKGIGTASGDIVLPYGYQGKFVTEIADNAFKGSEAVTGIYIPEKIALIGKAAFAECANLEHATWDAENCIKAGITYEEINDKKIREPYEYFVFENAGLKSLTIGKHAKIIPDCAFAHCTALTGELNIAANVTKIGCGAFGMSGLSAVTIGDVVTEISEGAFAECEDLESVIIGNGIKKIIGEKDVSAPTFGFCRKLKTVTIGSSVNEIGKAAFAECDALESILYNGTVEEWQAIDKKTGWDNHLTDYTITCTNGTIAKDGTVTLA